MIIFNVCVVVRKWAAWIAQAMCNISSYPLCTNYVYWTSVLLKWSLGNMVILSMLVLTKNMEYLPISLCCLQFFLKYILIVFHYTGTCFIRFIPRFYFFFVAIAKVVFFFISFSDNSLLQIGMLRIFEHWLIKKFASNLKACDTKWPVITVMNFHHGPSKIESKPNSTNYSV